MQQIILASQSPRRKQLLEWAEIDFTVKVSDADETFPPGLSFADAAIHIARNKAKTIAAAEPASSIIIAADTIVVHNNRILGKPRDIAEAKKFLGLLSGNSHEVITAVVIIKGEEEIAFADTTKVLFHPLTSEQVNFYAEKYKPLDKAGAYAIQEWIGVVGIKCIEGDFYNVMGLPVSRVVQALGKLR